MAMQDANDKSISAEESSNDTDFFDQLQQDFDALISTEKLPASAEPAEIDDTLIDQELEDTSALSAETTAATPRFDPEAEIVEEPVSEEPVSEVPVSEEADTASGETPPQKIFLSDKDLSGTQPDDSPDSDLENNNDTLQASAEALAAELDTTNPFEEDAPAYADLSGVSNQQGQKSSRFIALASTIVLVAVGGIYWLTTSSDKQPDETAVTQKESTPKQTAVDSNKSSVTSPAAAGKATAMQPATDQSTNGTATPPENEISKTAVATQGIKHDPLKPVTKAQTKTRKADIQRAAVEKAKARRSAGNQITVIEPVTPLQEKHATTEKEPNTSPNASPNALKQTGNWTIDLASVNSDKSARQHVARIRAMGVESRVVQVNDKGRIYHHIRVDGFSSQQAAVKRRDALVKLLGLRDATVFNMKQTTR